MPLLISYLGRPVKRRYRVAGGLRLVFFSPQRGQAREQITVTEAEWLAHGRFEYFALGQRPDRRELAARAMN